MALFLLANTDESTRNASAINAALAVGSDETAARAALAAAVANDGETSRNIASWVATQLATGGTITASPAVRLLGAAYGAPFGIARPGA